MCKKIRIIKTKIKLFILKTLNKLLYNDYANNKCIVLLNKVKLLYCIQSRADEFISKININILTNKKTKYLNLV